MLLTSFLSLGEFLSTLSLRRATLRNTAHRPAPSISIHALLTESDSMALGLADAALISIHALLTESDPAALRAAACCLNFYPRSPYGERRIRLNMWRGNNDFYPRSPYGERPCSSTYRPLGSLISIHALLTESDPCARCIWRMCGNISIHALLTESDGHDRAGCVGQADFYPRSPYGERPANGDLMLLRFDFYPRSPYGERRAEPGIKEQLREISIHALLTESDGLSMLYDTTALIFLSTLSLRRATPC